MIVSIEMVETILVITELSILLNLSGANWNDLCPSQQNVWTAWYQTISEETVNETTAYQWRYRVKQVK